MIEYLIIGANTVEKLEDDLNKASAEGWRVVCSCGKKGDKVILKRKSED